VRNAGSSTKRNGRRGFVNRNCHFRTCATHKKLRGMVVRVIAMIPAHCHTFMANTADRDENRRLVELLTFFPNRWFQSVRAEWVGAEQ
jgi:hypothetical protein